MSADSHHRDVTMSFRVVGLPAAHEQAFREVVGDREPKFRYRPDGATAVVTVGIDPEFPIDRIADFLAAHRVEEHGVWLSIATEADHDGLRLPAHVLRVVRELGGMVDFSFVSLP